MSRQKTWLNGKIGLPPGGPGEQSLPWGPPTEGSTRLPGAQPASGALPGMVELCRWLRSPGGLLSVRGLPGTFKWPHASWL